MSNVNYSQEEVMVFWANIPNEVSVVKYFELLEYYGNIENFFNNFDAKDPKLNILREKTKILLAKTRNLEYLYKSIGKYTDIRFTTYLSQNYPKSLKEIYDFPTVLYYKGSLEDIGRCISIIGTRKCTNYGKEIAKDIGYNLAKNDITICSGGAVGIDTSALEGAISAGGKAVVVLGSGFKNIYPLENEHLFDEIISKGGVILTEFKPQTPPLPHNFPVRNRILSGISKGVVVVETSMEGGSHITASLALEQGRDVFSVPGPVNSKASEGTNHLIKQGAILTNSYIDIMEEYNWEDIFSIPKQKIEFDNEEERVIYSLIAEYGKISVDDIGKFGNIDIVSLNSTLTLMELKGMIKKVSGKMFTL